MGGSQGGSQGAAGKVVLKVTDTSLVPSADFLSRGHMAKTPSDLSP